MSKIDAGLRRCRAHPLSPEEVAAGLSPERRLEVARARANTYARRGRDGDPYAKIVAEVYARLAERLAMEVAVGKRRSRLTVAQATAGSNPAGHPQR